MSNRKVISRHLYIANILVFSLCLKKTIAFGDLSLGLFKFAECKDDAGNDRLADGLSKSVEHLHTETILFWAPDLPLIFQVGRVN